MTHEEIIRRLTEDKSTENKLAAVYSYLNVIMEDIEEAAPIVMDYCGRKRVWKSTILDRFEFAKHLLEELMNNAINN